MPATDKAFERFEKHCSKNFDRMITDMSMEIDKHFPVKADQEALYEWAARSTKALWGDRLKCPTDIEIISKIASMRFTNDKSLRELCGLLQRDHRPRIYVGHEKSGIGYRINPEAYDLQPHHDNAAVNIRPYSTNILGVNTNCSPMFPQPSGVHKTSRSEYSTKPFYSTGPDTDGFTFHQIGILEYYEPTDDKGKMLNFGKEVKSKEDADQLEEWDTTGFNAVVRIDSRGYAEGVYAIFNMFPMEECFSKRHQVKTNDEFWGILPRCNKSVSMFKIADSIQSLNFGTVVTFTKPHNQTVEIVRAWKMLSKNTPRILRCVRPNAI